MYDTSRPFEPFIFQIARNVAEDRKRYLRRRPSQALPAGAPVPRAPARGAEEDEQMAVVRECVAMLPEQVQSVLLLWQGGLGELTLEQVGEVLGLSVAAVHARKVRALELLRDWLQRRGVT